MIVIALGANLASRAGPPEKTILAAIGRLAEEGLKPVAVSPLYVSDAWPDSREPPFVNAAARIETSLAPEALMKKLLDIEKEFGRVRDRPNAPRTLDIDLLDYNGVIRENAPALPHPRMHTRGFVLVPLADVVPAWRHPVSGKSVGELLSALPERERILLRLDSIST